MDCDEDNCDDEKDDSDDAADDNDGDDDDSVDNDSKQSYDTYKHALPSNVKPDMPLFCTI